jgi:YgiT-type zinc finger domain-containing protein
MKCPICKGEMEIEYMSYRVTRQGQPLLVEEVPTWVCERCGEYLVDEEVETAVEEMLDQVDLELTGESPWQEEGEEEE